MIDEAGLTYDVDYTRCAYVHDEVQLSVVPQEVDRVKELLENAAPLAGKHYKFRVPIAASAASGDNWAMHALMFAVNHLFTILYKYEEVVPTV